MDNKLIAIRERKTCLMKNKLLITTALVATAFVVNSAMAEQLVVNSGSTETVSEDMAGNKSHLGGAVYNLGELTVKEGVSFEGNSAHQGGAIYGANGSTNTLENNVSFIGNKAHLENGPGDAGGAIYLSGAGSKLTAGNNISFKGNEALQEKFEYADGGVAKGAAGAIYAYDSTVKLGNGATFENNKSRYAAGAVYNWNANQGSFEFGDEAKFLNNESLESYGGAIGNFDGDMTIGEKAVFNGNKAGAEGGAIANMTFSTNSSSLEINDGTSFTNNTAGTKGGAIYNGEGGSITFNGTTTFSGNKANGKLNDIHNDGTINIAENATLILDGGITGNGSVAGDGNIDMNSADSVIENDVDINGIYFKDTHTLSNAIKGNLAVKQMMIDNGGSLTADEAFNVPDLVIGGKNSGTGSLILKANVTAAGAKVNTGSTLDLGDKTLKVEGSHPQGNNYVRLIDGSTLAFNFGKGQILGGVNLEGAVNLNPTIAMGTEDGEHTFVTGDITRTDKTQSSETFGQELSEDVAKWVGFANNSLYNIELVDDKTLNITKKSTSEVAAATGANANQANAIAAVTSGESDNATFNTIANNINGMLQSSNKAEVKAGLDAIIAMSPDVAPLVQKTSVETTNQVFNAVGTRLSGGSIRSASEGKASGDNIFERAAVWVQTLFNKSKLDDTSKAKGFDADSTGIAFGAEKFVNDDVKVGVGYAFTNTDIDGFMRDTDVDTHTAIVYGEYKPSNWYVNGIANYNWSDYSEDKNVAGIGVKADYDVETFGLQTMTGYDMDVNGVNVTPEAGLRYFHVKQDSYKDSAGNKISSDDADILTGVIGAKVNKDFALENGMNIRPEARFAVTYDLMDADNSSFVTLANGAAYNVEGESLDRFGMEFGAGVTAEVNDNVELSLGYEGKFREDYQDHTGLLNAKYKF